MRIGDDLRKALENPGSNPDVFDRLNSYEKTWRSLRNINNKFMPGYDKTEHVTYSTTFNTTAVTNEQTIVDNSTYVYDGTRWVTQQRFMCSVIGEGISASNNRFLMPRISIASGIVILKWHLTTRVNTTNDGSNDWGIGVVTNNSTFSAGGTLSSLSATTHSDTADIWTNHDDTPSAGDSVPAAYGAFSLEITKNGSPGTLDFFTSIEYRHIGA